MERLRVFFSGTVQGVGFRYFVQNCARQFAVSGWVRNRSDGRVELLAEGARDELTALLAEIYEKKSGYINGRELHWEAASAEFSVFSIAATL